jgi:YihY family inner membrane protein
MNPVERALRRVDAVQQRHTVPAFLFGVVKKYGDDNAGNLSVQLTYAMFVTVFPLLLLLVSVLSLVLGGHPGLRRQVLHSAFGQFPVIGTQLAHNVHALHRSSVVGLVVGVVGLVYGTTGLAQAGLFAMAQIWNVPGAVRPAYVARLARSFLFLAVLFVGLVATTALTGFGTFGRHDVWLGLIGEVVAGAVNIAVYLTAFRVLTPPQVETRWLVPGAVLGGIAWTVLQALGGYVVGHDLKGASALYGLFGLVLGLIAWITLGVQMTLYSAEVNTVLHLRLWPRGMVQPPLTEADQRSVARQATQNRRRPDQRVVTSFENRPMSQDEFREAGYREDEGSAGLTVASPGRGDPG